MQDTSSGVPGFGSVDEVKRQASTPQSCRHSWQGMFGAAQVGLAEGGEEGYLLAVSLLQQLNFCLELGEVLVPDIQVRQGKVPVKGSHLLQADTATSALFQRNVPPNLPSQWRGTVGGRN